MYVCWLTVFVGVLQTRHLHHGKDVGVDILTPSLARLPTEAMQASLGAREGSPPIPTERTYASERRVCTGCRLAALFRGRPDQKHGKSQSENEDWLLLVRGCEARVCLCDGLRRCNHGRDSLITTRPDTLPWVAY